MNLQEITQLISIRDYVRTSIENLYLDKDTAKSLQKILPILDRKIVDLLQSENFGDYLIGKVLVQSIKFSDDIPVGSNKIKTISTSAEKK